METGPSLTPDAALRLAMSPGWADIPVLIAGPTASGKSALAMRIASTSGGRVVNADAMQVHAAWRVLTARPSAQDEMAVPHALYGHVDDRRGEMHSTGHWLREVAPLLHGPRPVVVGGSGLLFAALTEGLAEIPRVPDAVRAEADRLLAQGLPALVAGLDPRTAQTIDLANPARVRRAWEVRAATGRGLADWHDRTGPPLLDASRALRLRIDAPPDWLSRRIALRFDAMLAGGALDEVRDAWPRWDPAQPWTRVIGAADLVEHLQGRATLDEACARAIVATRRYAKRQRTWLRRRMSDWFSVVPTR